MQRGIDVGIQDVWDEVVCIESINSIMNTSEKIILKLMTGS